MENKAIYEKKGLLSKKVVAMPKTIRTVAFTHEMVMKLRKASSKAAEDYGSKYSDDMFFSKKY